MILFNVSHIRDDKEQAMSTHRLQKILQVIYGSFQKPIPEILKTADDLLPDAIDEERDPSPLFDALLADGWLVEMLPHGERIAINNSGNIAACIWYYGSICNAPLDVRLGYFKPWKDEENESYRDGYLDAVELRLSVPSSARFGNGKPVCLIGFSPYDKLAWIAYWQSSLVENPDLLTEGKHGEDEAILLHMLEQIGSDDIHHNKSGVTEPGDTMLRYFNWPHKVTK